MSNPGLKQPTPDARFLESLTGVPLPNGCPDCGATQVVDRDDAGRYFLTKYHDPTCPTLRRDPR